MISLIDAATLRLNAYQDLSLKVVCCSGPFRGNFVVSHEHFSQAVRACGGDVRPRRVEGHVEDALVEFLPVRRYFLHARLVVQVPQPYRTVVRTFAQKIHITKLFGG